MEDLILIRLFFLRRDSMQRENDFTQGKILAPLLTFMLPVFFAMFRQAMHGAVNLMIVGQSASSTAWA